MEGSLDSLLAGNPELRKMPRNFRCSRCQAAAGAGVAICVAVLAFLENGRRTSLNRGRCQQ